MLQRRDVQVTINAILLNDAMSIPESLQNGIFWEGRNNGIV